MRCLFHGVSKGQHTHLLIRPLALVLRLSHLDLVDLDAHVLICEVCNVVELITRVHLLAFRYLFQHADLHIGRALCATVALRGFVTQQDNPMLCTSALITRI